MESTFVRGGLFVRRYIIYLLETDVAKNYIGKEKMLYQLFYEAENKISPYQSIVKKQINYITRKIELVDLHTTFMTELKNVLKSYERGKLYEVQIDKSVSRAVLIVKPNYLSIYSYGSLEAEAAFFEVLRKMESSFLAIDFKNDNYGWLNPTKQMELA